MGGCENERQPLSDLEVTVYCFEMWQIRLFTKGVPK